MIRIFPVAASGDPKYSDDFATPRDGGRTHEGIDIFAAAGTPVFAVQAGGVRTELDPRGGLVVWLLGTDARHYYYAHLQSVEGPMPRAVAVGDVIGRVGSTGNAAGKSPHLHFQIHTVTGETLNPFPELLGFLPVDSRSPSSPSSPRSLNSAAGFGVVLLVLLLLSSKR